MERTDPALDPSGWEAQSWGSAPSGVASWGAQHAHDPTAVRDDDGTYWLFSTDACSDGPVRGGVQLRHSPDLVTWRFHGWALDGVPAPAAEWSGAAGLWAPDVVRAPEGAVERWRMYYSASTFGSRTSAIGLAVAAAPGGPWEDRGLVVTSRHEPDTAHGTGGPNAIDANAVVDETGRHWLLYGSFFGGIYALELDPVTGFSLDAESPNRPVGGPGILLARRPASVEGAVEGAFALPRPGGGWALIVSYDSLFSTYHVRVGVGDAVTGPFRDRAGSLLTDVVADPSSVGTTILAGHQFDGGRPWLAPGHGSVLSETDRPAGPPARQLFVHHVRDGEAPDRHEVQVRRLVWTRDGWPLVSPQPWAGSLEPDQPWPSDPAVLLGTWEVVSFAADAKDLTPSATVEIGPDELDGILAFDDGLVTWQHPDLGRGEAVVFGSWDAVRERVALSFAAMDGAGRVWVGTRVGR